MLSIGIEVRAKLRADGQVFVAKQAGLASFAKVRHQM